MSLYFLAWSSSILFGLEAIIAKLISKHSIENYWLFNFFRYFFVLILTFPVALYFGAGVPSHFGNIFYASVFFALTGILNTISYYKLDISVISPLFSFRTIMSVIAGAFVLGEVLTTHQYILIALIFICGILVSLDERMHLKSFFSWNIFIALMCMLAATFAAVFIKYAIAENGFWNVTLWLPILGQFWLLFTIPLFKDSVSILNLRHTYSFISVAVVRVLATLTLNAAYAKNVTITSVIVAVPLSMFIAFLFSIYAPNLLEKHTFKVYAIRFVSAAIMIVAALNL